MDIMKPKRFLNHNTIVFPPFFLLFSGIILFFYKGNVSNDLLYAFTKKKEVTVSLLKVDYTINPWKGKVLIVDNIIDVSLFENYTVGDVVDVCYVDNEYYFLGTIESLRKNHISIIAFFMFLFGAIGMFLLGHELGESSEF